MSPPIRPAHRTLADYIAWCLSAERGESHSEPPGLPLDARPNEGAAGPQDASGDAQTSPDTPLDPFEVRAAHLAAPLHRALAYWRLRTTDVQGFVAQARREALDIVGQWKQTGARRPLLPCTEPGVPELADWRLDWALHEHVPPAVARSFDMESLFIRRALRPVFVAGVNAGGSAEQFISFAVEKARALVEAFESAPEGFEFLVRAPLEPREPLA